MFSASDQKSKSIRTLNFAPFPHTNFIMFWRALVILNVYVTCDPRSPYWFGVKRSKVKLRLRIWTLHPFTCNSGTTHMIGLHMTRWGLLLILGQKVTGQGQIWKVWICCHGWGWSGGGGIGLFRTCLVTGICRACLYYKKNEFLWRNYTWEANTQCHQFCCFIFVDPSIKMAALYWDISNSLQPLNFWRNLTGNQCLTSLNQVCVFSGWSVNKNDCPRLFCMRNFWLL